MTQAVKTQERVSTHFSHTAKPQLSVVEGGMVSDDAVELFYVHRAIPVMNSRIGAKGECDFELVGVPIKAGMTPAQVRAMQVEASDVQTRRYRGFISQSKGDNGMVGGYVWAFKGGVPMNTMPYPAPRIKHGWQRGYDVMQEIEMSKRIAAVRNPAPKARHVKCVCGG